MRTKIVVYLSLCIYIGSLVLALHDTMYLYLALISGTTCVVCCEKRDGDKRCQKLEGV